MPRNAKMFDMTIYTDANNLRYLGGIEFSCRTASGTISNCVLRKYPTGLGLRKAARRNISSGSVSISEIM